MAPGPRGAALVGDRHGRAGAWARSRDPGRDLQAASCATITLFGFYYLRQALRRVDDGRPRAAVHRGGGLLLDAVGVLPCPLTMLVVTYAWVQSTVAMGFTLAALIAIGTAATISAVGGLGMLTRRGAILASIPRAGATGWY